MRKLVKYILLLSGVIIAFISCEDEIFPKGELEERYIVSCVLEADTDFQKVFISKSYDVDGFDAYENTIDPYVEGAEITLLVGNESYVFRDTSEARTNISRYSEDIHYYYLKDFSPVAGKTMKLRARMPDGTLLHSEIESFPMKILPGSFYRSDYMVPSDDPLVNTVYLKWGDFSEVVYYIPRLIIEYSINEYGVENYYEKLVPQAIVDGEPVYPTASIGDNITYLMAGMDYAMSSLVEGITDTSSITVRDLKFKILFPNASLWTYYSAAKTFSDSYTVHLTEPEYTNISGGSGVFGAFDIAIHNMSFSIGYIKSFGYSIPENYKQE